ncbi:hypothetical protein [Mesorhizobium sp. BH1-1-4]|uniref:DUF7657 domain-containing protein n=1 Tax=Mesorhizobium sp. BH1-1-4 TaxID=2876662 RepID=UPI001CD0C47D|nr:hypothetical protein [Mesorhizobium sp. BH1-1-4]MBZ9997322.1 hypothetical protein [Mesorhizobium sp. BH1-1-4]
MRDWWATSWTDEQTGWILLIGLLAVAAAYVGLALTPSHYAMGLRYLGSDASPLFLSARPIRSDEWIVLTPLFQTAVRGGFSTFNQISPYHESLKGFWALPILDWSLVFKPQLWGFWILPPAYAYSLYFAVLWTAFLAGYTILLRQLGADLWLAAFGAGCLFCSHMVQVWWTSHGATFAFAPWPLIVFLLPIRPWLKLPVLFWACAVWVFGFVYPPFMVPAAFSLGILLLAFRRDMLTPVHVLVAVLAAVCLGISFVSYFGDLIQTMRATVYPGGRSTSGGGVDEMRLLAYLFPFFTTARFSPLLAASNECEVAVVSTLLPMTILFFGSYRSFAETVRSNLAPFCIVGVGLIMMMAWMTLPIPSGIGKVLLWNNVQPGRMVWGFGLLLTISMVIFASKFTFVVTKQRVILFSLAMIAVWVLSKVGITQAWPHSDIKTVEALKRGYFEFIAMIPFIVGSVYFLYTHASAQHNARMLFCAAFISGAITFGAFNPFQQAFPIFNIPETPFLTSLREQEKTNPNGWAVVPGMYGALFSGAGVRAINHTLTAPKLQFFRRVFPLMPEPAFNDAFNRYAHIVPADVLEANSPYPDVAQVPITPFKNKIPD